MGWPIWKSIRFLILKPIYEGIRWSNVKDDQIISSSTSIDAHHFCNTIYPHLPKNYGETMVKKSLWVKELLQHKWGGCYPCEELWISCLFPARWQNTQQQHKARANLTSGGKEMQNLPQNISHEKMCLTNSLREWKKITF